MKKLLIILFGFFSLVANAYDFEVDGLYYSIIDIQAQTVKVVGYNSTSDLKMINIPTEVSFSGRSLPVIEIANEAIENNSNVTSVVIGDNIISIGSRAFSGCVNLVDVVFGNKLQTIGGSAFSGCKSLTSISIPPTVKKLGALGDNISKILIEDIESWCQIDFDGKVGRGITHLFINNKLVTDLEIPNSVSLIKPYSFAGFKGIKSVKIPDSVKKIDKYSFQDSGISNVILTNSLDSIMSKAFAGTEIDSLYIPSKVKYIETLGSMPKLRVIDFEESSDKIELVFEAGKIGYAQPYPPTYHSFFVDNDNSVIEKLYIRRPIYMNCGEKEIDSYSLCKCLSAFYKLKSLKKVIIGKKCDEITPRWFSACSDLDELIIEDGDTPLNLYQNIYYQIKRPNRYPPYDYICKYVPTFDDCPLKYVYLGRELKYTQMSSSQDYSGRRKSPFEQKDSLKTVIIGNSVSQIPEYLLYGNVNLEYLEIGQSLCDISEKCLDGDLNLKEIVLHPTVPPGYVTGFTNSNYLYTKLYVPSLYLEAYSSTEPWKYFWNICNIEDKSGIQEIVIGKELDLMEICPDGFIYRGNNSENLYVYDLTGKLYFSSIVKYGEKIFLSSGVYVVKIGKITCKIAI